MRMKDEPEVEEEEEEEEEEKEKEEYEKKTEDVSSRLLQETKPETAMWETSAPTDLTCSKETKSHGIIFLLPVLFSGAAALIVD
jgi:hypothetical protein